MKQIFIFALLGIVFSADYPANPTIKSAIHYSVFDDLKNSIGIPQITVNNYYKNQVE